MVQSPSSALYVNPVSGNDSAAGTQAAPFKTIVRALQQARSGVIQLAPGTYDASSGEVFPLVIPGGVTVVGNESVKGNGILVKGGGIYASPTFAGQNVTFRMETNAQLRGVTVTNPNTRGTGAWMESTAPTIAGCTFTECKREGVFATGSANPIVVDCVFIRNDANGVSIVRNTKGEFRRNVCQNTGFGFAIGDNAAPLLIENRISENRNGIVLSRSARPVLRNNVIEKSTESGLVAVESSVPNLGSPQDPGGNILRDNGEFDLQNATNPPITIVSVGNQINPTKISGSVDLLVSQVPTPTPTPSPIPSPTPTPTPSPIPTPTPTPVPVPIPTPTPTPTPSPTPTPAPSGELADIRGHWAESFVQGLISRGAISGFPDGTFKPEASLTRAEFAAIVFKSFDLPFKQEAPNFSDVAQNYWAYEAIRRASRMGFITGFPDGSFRPGLNITRVQALVALVNGAGWPDGTPNNSNLGLYRDRDQIPSYAVNKVATATQRRLVVNYPNVAQLKPLQDITRAEVTTFIYQALVASNKASAIASAYIVNPDTATTAFTDITSHWAKDFILGLSSQNFIQGFADGTFKPDTPMTRAQYATLLAKAFNPTPKRQASTFSDVPGDFWAKGAIEQAYRAGFISGFPDGTFKPNQNVTRLQLVLSLVSGFGLTPASPNVLAIFDDRTAIPSAFQDRVAAAAQADIIVNYPKQRQFNPNREASRADVSAMVYQTLVRDGRVAAIDSPYVVTA